MGLPLLQALVMETFIHSRAFMDYHTNRFDDLSVVILMNDNIVGVFPAHASGPAVASH